MTLNLRCYSFHSVKGGVGKSTLSTRTAVALAQEHPDARVYLVDMDLTGTSLADVLPLEAPRWEGIAEDEPLPVLKDPVGFHPREESRRRMKQRGRELSDTPPVLGVPFLNDHLLFEPEKWDEEHDVGPLAIAWRMAGGPENLRVLPSSALPRDLRRAMPVIYDEEHAAFLEARLEYLLAAIVAGGEASYVVFDTPPTIPGLSKSVLNLAFRLGRDSKTPLAEDGFIPYPLDEATIEWKAMLVSTQDMQDIRAAARWLDLVSEEDRRAVRWVINRARGEPQWREENLRSTLRDAAEKEETPRSGPDAPLANLNPLTENPIWIDEDTYMQDMFRGEGAPVDAQGFLEKLDDGRDEAVVR